MSAPSASKAVRSAPKALAALVGFIIMLLGGCVVLVGGFQHSTLASGCISNDGNTDPILATIRHIESGDNYTIESTGSTASGAYQFVDGTWAGYGGYSHAAFAPPAVQDAKALDMVNAILEAAGGDVGMVPVVWYLGHVPSGAEWDVIPAPSAGNRLTPRQYQALWLDYYRGLTSTTTTTSIDPTVSADPAAVTTTTMWTLNRCTTSAQYRPGTLPPWDGPKSGNEPYTGPINDLGPAGVSLPHQLACSGLTWGGYQNGRIPMSAMRNSNAAGPMEPSAAVAYDRLAQAGADAGFDFKGWSYRPADAQAGSATAGKTCHGLGLAVDITNMDYRDGVTCGGSFLACLATPQGQWLLQHAADFGFILPDYALACRGHSGTQGGVCEPWHVEYVAYQP